WFFFSSRRRHTRSYGDWSSDVCSSDLTPPRTVVRGEVRPRIRTITAFINLDPAQYKQQVAETMTMLRRAKTIFESRGYQVQTLRSEERRVGKEGRSRRLPYDEKENIRY